MSLTGTSIVFVSGLSGSGKTTAMAALEDLSFYCADNLPPQLVEQFIDLCGKSIPPIRKIAVSIYALETIFLQGIPELIARLRGEGATVELICLDCSGEILVNRYRETRRVHPLSPTGSVEEGIEIERRVLLEIFGLADFVVDTSQINIHQLREILVRHVGGMSYSTVVNLISFGFRNGPPRSSELLFDVRFLPNPHFEPHLRERAGTDTEVSRFILQNDPGSTLLEKLRSLLVFLMPLYEKEGKAYLNVGIGCTGGRHRSVAVVEALARFLKDAGWQANISHRDIESDCGDR